MPSVTVKVPTQLNKKLRATARRRGETISMVARRALEREVVSGGPDFAAIAARHRGMFRGSRDLSTREGYGSGRRIAGGSF
jgi:predicted transcriptional regulator